MLTILVSMVSAQEEGLQRNWKSLDGSSKKMELISSDGRTAHFRAARGRKVEIPMKSLALEDRKIIRSWLEERAGKQPMKPWPRVVEVPLSEVEVNSVGEKDGWHLYETEHFLFRSQEPLAISLMREVARAFEATHRYISVMPWVALPPRAPGRKFEAELYATTSAYHEAGGPKGTSGVYLFGYKGARHHGRFLLPFESIGVRKVGKGFRKDENFSADTLIHEISHQLMHFSLFLLPSWVAEGSAEFFESTPYHAGRFRPEALPRDLKEVFHRQGRATKERPLALEKSLLGFVGMDEEGWDKRTKTNTGMSRAYEHSLLLFFYLAHLDPPLREGARPALLRYFSKVNSAQQKWTNYLDEWSEYLDAWDEFLGNPEVKKLPDGRYEFPETLHPPEAPENPYPDGVEVLAQKLTKELVKGRQEESFRADLIAAYQELGIYLK